MNDLNQSFKLGFHDMIHYIQDVINTSIKRGSLSQTPLLSMEITPIYQTFSLINQK